MGKEEARDKSSDVRSLKSSNFATEHSGTIIKSTLNYHELGHESPQKISVLCARRIFS